MYANENPAAYAKSQNAESQLPAPPGDPSRTLTMSHSVTAPETMRIDVKVAASIVVSFNAARHRSELPAKAIIARSVRTNAPGPEGS